MKKPEIKYPENVAIPFTDLIKLILGDEGGVISCNEIPLRTAGILNLVLPPNDKFHLEITDENDVFLNKPKLWWKKDWDTSQAKAEKRRLYSDRMRRENYARNHNMNLVTRAIIKKTPLPEIEAIRMANMLLNTPNAEVVLYSFWKCEQLKTADDFKD